MKKCIALLIPLFLHFILSSEQLATPLENPRGEKPVLYFKNMSSYPITVVAENNQQITLRPNDSAWPFKVGYDEVAIVAHLDNYSTITMAFNRESDDEVRWNIHVYKPIKAIRIERLNTQY